MILRRGLRLAESSCPSRLFSSHGNPLGRYVQPPNPTDNHEDLHEDLNWVRNEQNSQNGTRRTNLKMLKALENERVLKQKNEAAHRASEMQFRRVSNWKLGDLYTPHDLSLVEVRKRGTFRPPNQDAFDVLSINPLLEYKNPSIMWEYMAPIGNIRHRKETGLRPVNQRRIAKAIRRAVGMGLIPSVHPHPEVLEAAAVKREAYALKYGKSTEM